MSEAGFLSRAGSDRHISNSHTLVYLLLETTCFIHIVYSLGSMLQWQERNYWHRDATYLERVTMNSQDYLKPKSDSKSSAINEWAEKKNAAGYHKPSLITIIYKDELRWDVEFS